MVGFQKNCAFVLPQELIDLPSLPLTLLVCKRKPYHLEKGFEKKNFAFVLRIASLINPPALPPPHSRLPVKEIISTSKSIPPKSAYTTLSMIDGPLHFTGPKKMFATHDALRTNQPKPLKVRNGRGNQVPDILISDVGRQDIRGLHAKHACSARDDIVPGRDLEKVPAVVIGVGVVLNALAVRDGGRTAVSVVDEGAWAAVVVPLLQGSFGGCGCVRARGGYDE
jgi:hypothetical protein